MDTEKQGRGHPQENQQKYSLEAGRSRGCGACTKGSEERLGLQAAFSPVLYTPSGRLLAQHTTTEQSRANTRATPTPRIAEHFEVRRPLTVEKEQRATVSGDGADLNL